MLVKTTLCIVVTSVHDHMYNGFTHVQFFLKWFCTVQRQNTVTAVLL